jgi:hypothetical protein
MTPKLIRFKGAVYHQADPAYAVPPVVVATLRELDRWFTTSLEQLYRDGVVKADHGQAARWLRQLDEYLVSHHEERPANFEGRVYQQLEAVYSPSMSSDVVVYLTDGGFSRFILPDEPGKRLTITPHYHGIGSTQQVEARWQQLIALAR